MVNDNSSSDSDTMWNNDLVLTLEDERSLLRGEWLKSSHISAAQSLLKYAFPQQNGLCDTSYLREKYHWPSTPQNFVQIIHVNDHWVCLSNSLCNEDGVVELFDSLHSTSLDDTIIQQASTILCCQSPSFKIRVVNVQQQKGGETCGLFSIAFACDLCEGNDPFHSLYNESELQEHLYKCFQDERITPFPREIIRRNKRILDEVEVFVYCTCRNPEITSHLGNMACCCKCEEWYHEKCVAIPKRAFSQPDVDWFCFNCI